MQRGIDTYFKKAAKKVEDEEETKPAIKKRKALVISSDEEDEVVETPTKPKNSIHDNKKKRTDESASKVNGSASKKPSLFKLKTKPQEGRKKVVDPTSLFGGEILRVEAKKPPKPKEQALIDLEDDEINRSLMEIDIDPNIEKISKEKTPKKTPTKPDKTPTKSDKTPQKMDKTPIKSDKTPRKHENGHDKNQHNKEKIKEEKITPTSPKKQKLADEDNVHKKTPKTEQKKHHSSTTPRVKKEHQDLESSVLSDEERHERKRMSAILYQKYKNRSSCINPGSKEVPQGKANCLAGLSFLVTGVLESLERDEAGSIIKEYGGKVMSIVGKRLNYLIVGEDAGPKKLAQAEEYGTKILSEDGFFDLIRAKSGGGATKTNAQNNLNTETPATSKSPEEKIEKNEVKIKKEKTPVKKIKIKKEEHQLEELNDVKIKEEREENHKKDDIKAEDNNNNAVLAWVDKYKPKTLKEIVGQHGAASNVAKLSNWLSKWYINHDGQKKLQKPNPWAKNDDGSFYKAALLSGPPGIGKTTSATLVCQELCFDIVEFNASDTRSKRLLKEEVAELLHNKSLYGYFHGQEQAMSKKHVLIMDEVDGMAGNEDRGGMQELITLIKESAVPIICMCNDRNHPKIRSLVNYCYDLRFNRPRLEQIKACIMSICFKEKLKMLPAKIEEIIKATNQDIRQTINHISLLSAGKELNLKSDQVDNANEKIAQKDLKLGPWEVVRKVFSADEHKHMTFYDKCDLFFHDYSLAPLFVQQNYLQVTPVGPKSEILQKVALTADALSLGDLVDKRIRSNSAWALLPTQAVFSSVLPGEYMCGHFTGQINFPGWLGKNSRSSKRSRLAQEIHDHTRVRTSGSRLSVRQDYAPFLLAKIVRPLREDGLEGVEEALNVIKEYHLLRDDIESLIELTTWPGKKGAMDAVDGRVKAALTRAYNKEVLAYSYSAAAGVKKKKTEAAEDLELMDAEAVGEEGEAVVVMASDDEKDDDDLANDGLIKAKKKTTTAATKPSTSKAKSASSSKKATNSKASSKSKK